MNIKKLIKIKELFLKYETIENLKYKDDIMLIFLEDEISIELMKSINDNLLNNTFLETIEFLFFIKGYNYITEEEVSNIEMLSLDIILFEIDENDEIINKEYSMIDKFRVYKNKYLI